MITKERLEELIEQGDTIYFVYNGNVDEKEGIYKDDFILNETYVSIYWTTRSHQIKYENLFETLEQAEWVAKMNTERTEYFRPPFELKDNEKYKFTTAKGGKMSISKFIRNSGDVEWWLSYVGTHRTFYSYPEAVEYARKLFLGED